MCYWDVIAASERTYFCKNIMKCFVVFQNYIRGCFTSIRYKGGKEREIMFYYSVIYKILNLFSFYIIATAT